MKYKIVLSLLALTLCAAFLAGAAFAEPDAGGTQGTEIQVAEPADMEKVRSAIKSGQPVSVTLTADLVLQSWNSLGTSDTPFSGSFNGNGHAVTIENGGSLLGVVKNATVQDVLLFGTVNDSAALASSATNSEFTSCGNAAAVTNASGPASGLVGESSGESSYIRCFNTGIVKSTAENQIASGIAGPCAAGSDHEFRHCYSAGALDGDSVYPIGKDEGSSITTDGNLSTISGETSQNVTCDVVSERNLAEKENAGGWAGWTTMNGLYPLVARTAVTDGDIAATAAAWAEGETLVLNGFDVGVWEIDGQPVTEGQQVTLPVCLTFRYRALSRQVQVNGEGTVTITLKDAARLAPTDVSQSGCYLEQVSVSLTGPAGGIWSLESGSLPDGLVFSEGTIQGTVTAKPDTYTVRIACRDVATRRYTQWDLTLSIQKAQGGIAVQTPEFVYNGEQRSLVVEVAEHAQLESITYSETPENAGEYSATVKTQATDYYEAFTQEVEFTIRPYPLTAENFNREELEAGVVYDGTVAVPPVYCDEAGVKPDPDDYTVEYSNNTAPTSVEDGPAEVRIIPRGNFCTETGDPIWIEFPILVGSTEVQLAQEHGYMLAPSPTGWTLENESNRTVYSGGSVFYVKDYGVYQFNPAA